MGKILGSVLRQSDFAEVSCTLLAQAAEVVPPAVRCFVANAACTDAGIAGGVPGVSGVGAAAQPEPLVKPKPRPPSNCL